jgi:amino-acid N-acetyltransferase
MHARSAKLPDAFVIEQLIQVHVGDGTLLPRSLAEICENIRDFTVVEHEGEIVGCGALHLYGMHLAEIRSITVTNKAKGSGAGRVLIDALLAGSGEAKCDLCLPVHAHSPILRSHGL